MYIYIAVNFKLKIKFVDMPATLFCLENTRSDVPLNLYDRTAPLRSSQFV